MSIIDYDFEEARENRSAQAQNIVDLSLMYACVQLEAELANTIVSFARRHKYLIGISQ